MPQWLQTIAQGGRVVRFCDATNVSLPGNRGSYWRVHMSLALPNLCCDKLEITPQRGTVAAENLAKYDPQSGQFLIGDKVHCVRSQLAHVEERGSEYIVAFIPSNFPLQDEQGQAIEVRALLSQLSQPEQCQQWTVFYQSNSKRYQARLCVKKLDEQSAERARQRLKKSSHRRGPKPRQETLEYAGYVMVLTNVAPELLTLDQVLDLFRLRWQVELGIKRSKSLAGLSPLPHHKDKAVRAWIAGKLLVHALAEQVRHTQRAFSPEQSRRSLWRETAVILAAITDAVKIIGYTLSKLLDPNQKKTALSRLDSTSRRTRHLQCNRNRQLLSVLSATGTSPPAASLS
jgi:hypothetical protein